MHLKRESDSLNVKMCTIIDSTYVFSFEFLKTSYIKNKCRSQMQNKCSEQRKSEHNNHHFMD